MKRKIITTSTSTLSYIDNAKNIEIIPDLIKLSENEIYNDCIDYAPSMLVNRMAYDRFASPRVYPQKVFYIREFALRLKASGYDSLIFILPSSEILDYRTNLAIALGKIGIDYVIYESKSVGYMLAYLVTEAQRLADKGLSNDELLVSLKEIEAKMGFILLQYKNDLNLPLSVRINNLDINELDRNGKIYKMADGRLSVIKHDKEKSILVNFIEAFLNEISGFKTIPFIISGASTQYRMVIENRAIAIYNGLSRIENYPTPSILTAKLGPNLIALGYIKRD